MKEEKTIEDLFYEGPMKDIDYLNDRQFLIGNMTRELQKETKAMDLENQIIKRERRNRFYRFIVNNYKKWMQQKTGDSSTI
jgi:hypothetical protein